jgi:hypothetical protein
MQLIVAGCLEGGHVDPSCCHRRSAIIMSREDLIKPADLGMP